MNSIEAFILVGGRSSRMGRDKANVIFRGSRMVDSVALAIRLALPNARISIVAACDDQLAQIGDVANVDNYIKDIDQFRGPVGALHTAVLNSDTEWIFIAACDLPLLSAEFIAFLVEQIDTAYDVVIPMQPDGRPQPLTALYRVQPIRDHIEKLLSETGKTRSLREAIDSCNAKKLEFPDYRHLEDSHEIFTNVTFPDDVQN